MRTILVAFDGSASSEAAFPIALQLARTIGARIELVTVHEPPPGVRAISGAMVHDQTFDRQRNEDVRNALENALDRQVARMRQLPDAPPVTAALLDGRPADRLLEHAKAMAADAIVLATHGRGGVVRAWLGSVADNVLRRATVPVVSVRPLETSDAESAHALHNARRIERVLVTLDGNRNGWTVVEPLHGLFGNSVEYLLFRAVAPLHPLLDVIASDEVYARDLAEQNVLTMRYLEATRADLAARGLRASICTRTEIVPSTAICACGAENAVDLIAIATSVSGLVERLMLGSVADKVTRTSDLPVLVYRVDREDG